MAADLPALVVCALLEAGYDPEDTIDWEVDDTGARVSVKLAALPESIQCTLTTPLHDPDCPMTNSDPATRTTCVCDRTQWADAAGRNRTAPEGGGHG